MSACFEKVDCVHGFRVHGFVKALQEIRDGLCAVCHLIQLNVHG